MTAEPEEEKQRAANYLQGKVRSGRGDCPSINDLTPSDTIPAQHHLEIDCVLVFFTQLVGKPLQYFHSGVHVTCKYIMACR